jgi:hypothetical protein
LIKASIEERMEPEVVSEVNVVVELLDAAVVGSDTILLSSKEQGQ